MTWSRPATALWLACVDYADKRSTWSHSCEWVGDSAALMQSLARFTGQGCDFRLKHVEALQDAMELDADMDTAFDVEIAVGESDLPFDKKCRSALLSLVAKQKALKTTHDGSTMVLKYIEYVLERNLMKLLSESDKHSKDAISVIEIHLKSPHNQLPGGESVEDVLGGAEGAVWSDTLSPSASYTIALQLWKKSGMTFSPVSLTEAVLNLEKFVKDAKDLDQQLGFAKNAVRFVDFERMAERGKITLYEGLILFHIDQNRDKPKALGKIKSGVRKEQNRVGPEVDCLIHPAMKLIRDKALA